MASFDIKSELDLHELTNAVDQANRVLKNRFDFKGTGAAFLLNAQEILLTAKEDFQIKQMDVSSSYVAVATRDHYNSMHLKKVLECSVCTYTSLRYKTLREHRKKYHGLNVMKCTEERCLFSSDFETDMLEHYKKGF